jgi:hypothetical protein
MTCRNAWFSFGHHSGKRARPNDTGALKGKGIRAEALEWLFPKRAPFGQMGTGAIPAPMDSSSAAVSLLPSHPVFADGPWSRLAMARRCWCPRFAVDGAHVSPSPGTGEGVILAAEFLQAKRVLVSRGDRPIGLEIPRSMAWTCISSIPGDLDA